LHRQPHYAAQKLTITVASVYHKDQCNMTPQLALLLATQRSSQPAVAAIMHQCLVCA
jgi:hypothetical protein